MSRKTEKVGTGAFPKEWRIACPGEVYNDLITIDARINQRTISQQASSLLAAKIMEREERIRERVSYLAKKRGLSFDAMWRSLADGSYEPLLPGDWADEDETGQ